MTIPTQQENVWLSDFGKNYTDRNPKHAEELDAVYQKCYGITRTKMNDKCLANLDKTIRILEVGCNVGNQLSCLQNSGYQNLYGIELQPYAVTLCQKNTSEINIIQGSAFDIPFKNGFFDLVFTSGVLIHINPDNIIQALSEIYRCSNTYIWGFEYYSDQGYQTVNYRGHDELLWKTNFAQLYQQNFPELQLPYEKHYPHLDNKALIDSMFLLQK